MWWVEWRAIRTVAFTILGDIWACIRKYADDHLKTDPRSKTSIFKYIMSSFGYDESEVDEELTQKYRLSLDAAKT